MTDSTLLFIICDIMLRYLFISLVAVQLSLVAAPVAKGKPKSPLYDPAPVGLLEVETDEFETRDGTDLVFDGLWDLELSPPRLLGRLYVVAGYSRSTNFRISRLPRAPPSV